VHGAEPRHCTDHADHSRPTRKKDAGRPVFARCGTGLWQTIMVSIDSAQVAIANERGVVQSGGYVSMRLSVIIIVRGFIL